MLLLGNQMVKKQDGSMIKLEDLAGSVSELTPETPVNVGGVDVDLEDYISDAASKTDVIETVNNNLTKPKVAWGYAGRLNGYFDFKITNEHYFLLRVTGWINNDAVYKKDAIVFYEDGEGWACLYSSGDEEITFYTDDSPETPEGSWIRFINTSDMKVVVEIIGIDY